MKGTRGNGIPDIIQFKRLLRDHGLKATPQRTAVHEAMSDLVHAGADDVEAGEGSAIFYTDPNELTQVRDSLEAAGCTFLSVERAMIPDNTVEITDMELAGKIQKLLDWLDDYDDTQNVYHDAQLPEMDDEEE